MYKILLLILFFPFFVSADVTITEIMYDLEGSDSKREWIKICGDDNLSGWKFNDGSNHALNEPPKNGGRGSIILTECLILASDAITYINDNPSYSGTVIDTVMSLGNTEDTLSLINPDGDIVFSVTYNKELGANGDGNFLQYLNGEWGVSGQIIENTESTVETTGLGPVFQEEMKITAFAGSNRTVSVGADVVFIGHAYGDIGEPLERSRHIWNFGDGSTIEGERVLHHYDYPGEYVVFLSVSNVDVTKYSSTDRIIVTALPAEIRIKDVNPEFIILENYGDRELDLSFWIIKSGFDQFILPENTIALGGRDLILSYDITHLGVPNKYDVSILYPNREMASSYKQIIIQNNIESPPVVIKPVVIKEEIIEVVEIQPATVVLAKKSDNNSGWFLALIGIIIIGIVSAIVIRRKT